MHLLREQSGASRSGMKRKVCDAVTEQVGATDLSGSTEEALPSEPNRNSEWSWIRAGLEHRRPPAYKQDTSP